ncbi:hypothetical protein TEA_027197 [Camellia sinensis var. sinensis]|uniref:Signal recognition particle 14 kDa protein n=1 Tax=Camellia sinensis var. sinensis TaxID=542762 RepID=A0A4S4E9C7_CAMSN|nr:hypothetical protein TEA_027197 [Camellia sinensis var. sinensis]
MVITLLCILVLLQPDPFLNELTSMFERSTEKGSVWVTLKRSSMKSKAQRKKMGTAGDEIEYRCLVRATCGKKTISTSAIRKMRELADSGNKVEGKIDTCTSLEKIVLISSINSERDEILEDISHNQRIGLKISVVQAHSSGCSIYSDFWLYKLRVSISSGLEFISPASNPTVTMRTAELEEVLPSTFLSLPLTCWRSQCNIVCTVGAVLGRAGHLAAPIPTLLSI